MVVVVPLTCKLPLITTNPALPTVAGSIVSVVPRLLIKSPVIVMLPELMLPPVMLPVELNAVNIPTLVMLACALPVTVVDVVALVAVPALVAKVALATVPVTLAPVMLDSKLPLPTKYPAVTLPVVLTGFDPNAAKLATTLALP